MVIFFFFVDNRDEKTFQTIVIDWKKSWVKNHHHHHDGDEAMDRSESISSHNNDDENFFFLNKLKKTEM